MICLAPHDPVGGMAVMVVTQIIGDAFGVTSMILAASLRQSLIAPNLLGRTGARSRRRAAGWR